jgi:multicomponent Na+:H+ antiporter subunit F
MADVLTGAAVLILAATGLALLRMLSRRNRRDLMMTVQLLGTAGAAIVLLLSVGLATPAMSDVAVMLVLLAAFSATAFTIPSTAEAQAEDDA